MHKPAFGLAVLLLATLPEAALGQAGSTAASGSQPAPAPLHRVSFVRGDAVPGISATPAIKLPFQCTTDGTIFVSFVGTVPANSGLPPHPPACPRCCLHRSRQLGAARPSASIRFRSFISQARSTTSHPTPM